MITLKGGNTRPVIQPRVSQRNNTGPFVPHKKKGGNNDPLPEKKQETKRMVLDTNTLMNDYLAMFHFKYVWNNIFIPLMVLLELDKNKRSKGKSKKEIDAATNARKAARMFLYLVESVPISQIKNGIPLLMPGEVIPSGKSVRNYKGKLGKLFFEMPKEGEIEQYLDPDIPDHAILLSALKLKKECSKNSLIKGKEKGGSVVLVTNDTIMGILGRLVGLRTEKYENKALSDESFRSTGMHYFPLELLASQKTDNGEMPKPIPLQDGVKEYVFKSKSFEPIVMYEFLIFGPPRDPKTQKQLEPEKQRQYIVLEKLNPTTVRVRELKDFQYQNKVFYLNALNAEQNCFANAVVVYRVPMVIGEGEAGTGKTFFALGCAYQLIKDGVYPYTILTRDAVDSGQKLGYMPGGKEAKVGNYLPGALGAQKKLLMLLDEDIAQKSKLQKRREKQNEGERRRIEKQQRENERLAKQDQAEVTTSRTRRRWKEKKRSKSQSFQGNVPPTAESVEIKKLLELKALLAGNGTMLEGVNFMRGASYPTVVIVDESQHTGTGEGKMIASRMEEEGQLLLIGNVEQDDIGVPIRDSGVAKLIEATRGTDLMCLVTFQDVERSRLAARIARYYNK